MCLITILFVIVDVVGALIIPTFAADMLNQGTAAGADFSALVNTCVKMLAAALISGVATILGAYTCSEKSEQTSGVLYIKRPYAYPGRISVLLARHR